MSNKYTEQDLIEIFGLHQQGFSQRKIAEITGVPKSTIGDLLIGKPQYVQEFIGSKESTPASAMFTADEISVKTETAPIIERKPVSSEADKNNTRVLLISDMHIPYHHPDTIKFLQYLKDKYKPTRVICLGDELDKHSLSYHDSDPDLPSAGDELRAALPVVAEVHNLFPVMDIIESNHGSLVWRKAKTHGIPRHYIKSYQDVLQVGGGWNWYFDLTITLPDGKQCYIHHGKTTDVTKLSQQMGMNAIQGHYHEKFKVEYWGNPNGLFWGLQAGCLIDDKSYAFSYNNVNIKRPIIGTGLIINGHPILEPMVLGDDGRWVGE